MRSTPLITGALAVAATSALVGLGATTADATPDPSTPGTSRERGALVECTGTLRGTTVRSNLYQNDVYGNYLEVVVGDGPHQVVASRELARPFLVGTKVRAGVKVKGKRITITGTARSTGRTKHVHEVVEDAGLRITSNGIHRFLAPHLTFHYGKKGTTKLVCGNAFRFNLKVTKTSLVG